VKEEVPVEEEDEPFVPVEDSVSSSDSESLNRRSRSGTPVNGGANGVKKASATMTAGGKRRKPVKKKKI
jgi:hypothetical protein